MNQWIPLEEAQNRSHGKIEWWNVTGVHGERISPAENVVMWCARGDGRMYRGAWKQTIVGQRKILCQHGLGVTYKKDGRIYVGYYHEGKLEGPGKALVDPQSSIWLQNQRSGSGIPSSIPLVWLPFLYIGNFHNGRYHDERATVILKDGTTRIGPWKNGEIVGDWWEDHEKDCKSPEEIERLLSFRAPRPKKALGKRQSSTSESAKLGRTRAVVSVTKRKLILNEKTENLLKKQKPFPKKETKSTNEIPICPEGETGSKTVAAGRREYDTRRRREQIKSITNWLSQTVIGFDADNVQMTSYASHLRAEGFHSVDMIQEVCTVDDVLQFSWMETMHKRLFIQRSNLKRSAASENKC